MVRMQKRPSAQVARFRCHCTREQGDLAVESFYRVDSNLGVPLSTDLVSLLLGEGSFVPITNIDLGICRTQAFRSPRTSNALRREHGSRPRSGRSQSRI
jgi:hypothetical protein